MECARCGKPIYQNKYGKWKHYPYCGKARPQLDSSREDEVVERMARVGFESMHEDKWDDLRPESAPRHMWLGVASDMLTELRRTWEQAKLSHPLDRTLKKGGYYDCV